MLSVLEPTRATVAPAARFDDLFRSLYPGLVGLGARLLGERAEAEDIVQEAFVKLADDSVLARPDAEVAAWLRRVVLNLGTNRLRDRRRATDREERAGRLGAALANGEDEGPAREAVRREAREQVRSALAELPERQRACLLLRHAGHSYTEERTSSPGAAASNEPAPVQKTAPPDAATPPAHSRQEHSDDRHLS